MTAGKLTRRAVIERSGILVGAAVLGQKAGVLRASAKPAAPEKSSSVRYCLNTATIRRHKLGLVKEVEIAAQAGYDGIEPWMDSVGEYIKNGGKLAELKQRIEDSGLRVEGAIGFAEWVVEDDARRAKGLERAKREMEIVAQIGGRRMAAPPAGATDLPKLDLVKAAERYRVLLETGEQLGVVPQVEVWGFSKNLSRLGECVCVAMETGHRNACVLADVFHLYKGGSERGGIHLLGANTIQVLHMNDYPSDPPRERINDSYRLYPGDGVAPLTELISTLRKTGGEKVLSLELFNRSLDSEEALTIAKTGLAKMKAAVGRAQD